MPGMQPPNRGQDDFAWKAGLAAIGAFVGLYVLIPAIVAAATFWFLKNRLQKRDWWLLLGGSMVALTFGGGSGLLSEYTHWVTRFFPPFDDLYFSLSASVAVVMLASMLVSVLGLLNGTSIAARIPAFFKTTPMGVKPSIVPTDSERTRLSVVTPSAVDHVEVSRALVSQARVGERPIVLGPGRNGSPVVVTEKELGTHALIFGATGSGKALALTTPIPTPQGWTTMGDLQPGDRVFDESGTVCRVVFVTPSQLDRVCFEVVLSDNSVIVADADHRWLTTDTVTGTTKVRTTQELADTVLLDHTISLQHPLALPPAVFTPAELYNIGLNAVIGHEFSTSVLRSSIQQRQIVLQGVMSVCGQTRGDWYVCDTMTPQVALFVEELIRSLGGLIGPPELPSELKFKVDFNPYSETRTDDTVNVTPQDGCVRIDAVRPTQSVPVRCIQVDSPTHLYLAGRSMTPTHNTETIKSVAGGLLDLGWDGIILDLKEDTKPGGLRDWCETYADSHRIRYQELRLSDPQPRFWFDALSGLSQDEARDTILSLTRFDDEYYKNVSIKVLGQLMKLQYWAHEVDPVSCPLPTIYDIANILGVPSLAAASKKLRAIVTQAMPDLHKSEFQVLESPTQVEQQQAASWGSKLGNLYETQAGRTVLKQPAPGTHRQKLDVTSPGIIYIGLDSQGKPDLTKLVSSSVLQRISVESAQRTTGTSKMAVKPKFLIVDEANWVDRTIVQNLLSRARSAGVAMVLCTQGPKDWIDKDGDDFARLAQNTNVAMIMKQGEPEAAQICADYIGNMTYKEFTEKVDTMSPGLGGNLRDKLDNVVSPDELRGLLVGEMILRVSSPRVRTEWVRVNMRDPLSHPSGSVTQRAPELGPTKGPGLAKPPI